jgi:hypothetical protein
MLAPNLEPLQNEEKSNQIEPSDHSTQIIALNHSPRLGSQHSKTQLASVAQLALPATLAYAARSCAHQSPVAPPVAAREVTVCAGATNRRCRHKN